MSKAPADCVNELLKIAGCQGNETAARALSNYLEGAKLSLSPTEKFGPVWKDDWNRRLEQVKNKAIELANLLEAASRFYPYNFALGVVERGGMGEDAIPDELVTRLRALAKAAEKQVPQKNETALEVVCSLAVDFLREHSKVRIYKKATRESFAFVQKFAECVFARNLASDGPGGVRGAYERAVKDLDDSGQNLAPTTP